MVLAVDCHPKQKLIASGALQNDKSVKLWLAVEEEDRDVSMTEASSHELQSETPQPNHATPATTTSEGAPSQHDDNMDEPAAPPQ